MFWMFYPFLAIFFTFSLWGSTLEEKLKEAQAKYKEGEKATTYEERKLAFNQALFLYHSLAQEMQNPSLNQTLGDIYFQLGEYVWAVLYYQRALKQHVSNPLLFSHLEKAQNKLGIYSNIYQKKSLFFFSLSQQFHLLFWSILIAFFAFSILIWFPFPSIRLFANFSVVLLLLLLGSSLLTYYLTPLEGIVIKTTGIYRLPNENEPQLTREPLFAGTKIQILQITSDKNWLKIENREGLIGYIPISHLREI